MYQPVFPLKMGERDGAYKSISDIGDSIKQNVLFLLNTSPGEWPAQPELGVGIRRYLFENNSAREWEGLRARISQQFERYMPFLNVSAKILESPDGNSAKLHFRYDVKSLDIQENVVLNLTQEALG